MPSTSDCSPLLQHVQHLAKQRVKQQVVFEGSKQPYSRWLWLVAGEFGLHYGRLLGESNLLHRYYEHSFTSHFWSTPVSLFYKPDVFARQIEALVEAADAKQTLCSVAKRHGVHFRDFEFTVSLLDLLAVRTASLPIFDFSGLVAPGAVITQSWSISCERYAGADLENYRFVNVFCDPAAGPGASIHKGDFRNSNLAGSDFRRSYIRGSDFRGANLLGADFRNSQRRERRFEGAVGLEPTRAFLDVSDTHRWLVRGVTG